MSRETALLNLIRSIPGGTGAFGPPRLPRMPYQDDPKHLGAENLVAKAVARLHEGDESRARRSADQAAALGWHELEESPYGAFAARGVLFDEITDSLEAGEPSDWAWRDACLEILGDASELETLVLCDLLVSILNDYDLPKRETPELRRAVGDAEGDSSFGLDAHSSAEQVGAVVWAMVSLTSRLHDRLYH